MPQNARGAQLQVKADVSRKKMGDIIEAEVVEIHQGFAQLIIENYTATLLQEILGHAL